MAHSYSSSSRRFAAVSCHLFRYEVIIAWRGVIVNVGNNYGVANDLMNTEQAAEYLGLTKRRVQQMIKSEELPARKYGRDWLIEPSVLEAVKSQRAQSNEENRGRRGRPNRTE